MSITKSLVMPLNAGHQLQNDSNFDLNPHDTMMIDRITFWRLHAPPTLRAALVPVCFASG